MGGTRPFCPRRVPRLGTPSRGARDTNVIGQYRAFYGFEYEAVAPCSEMQMNLLAIDIGSSSIKAGILTGSGAPRHVVTDSFATRYDGKHAEVDERSILRALTAVIQKLGSDAKRVDAIVPTVMAPSWVAMDVKGRAITPIVTHQDRRAIAEARWIENRVGADRHLKLVGNRPFPGGISSTTWRWFATHEKARMKRADLVGHLSTWFIRNACGARVTDPSNAAFMGLYESLTLKGWSDELIAGLGVDARLLPEIREANQIAGHLTRQGAARFGLTEGTPVLTGCMDGSAAMLAAGGRGTKLGVGQMMNVSGSTDVLALLVDHPKPHPELLTRPLGVGKRWLAVSTIAAAGSALEWAKNTMYAEMDAKAFYRHLSKVAGKPTPVRFAADLAGSRTSIEELSGEITGLRLGTTRDDILAALCESLAAASGARLGLLKKQYRQINTTVVVSGGVQSGLSKVLRRDWPSHGKWKFRTIDDATLRGLWQLIE